MRPPQVDTVSIRLDEGWMRSPSKPSQHEANGAYETFHWDRSGFMIIDHQGLGAKPGWYIARCDVHHDRMLVRNLTIRPHFESVLQLLHALPLFCVCGAMYGLAR